MAGDLSSLVALGVLELFEITGDTLTPIKGDDPRMKLMPRYGQEADWFGGWAMWRHLKRAEMPQVAGADLQSNAATQPSQDDATRASFSGK